MLFKRKRKEDYSLVEIKEDFFRFCKRKGIKIYEGDTYDVSYAIVEKKLRKSYIELETRIFYEKRVTYYSIFVLFHELGHIMTNDPYHPDDTWEDEFLADQWAIDKLKEYGRKFPKKIREEFQAYLDAYDEEEMIEGYELVW